MKVFTDGSSGLNLSGGSYVLQRTVADAQLCVVMLDLGDAAKPLDGTGGNFTIRVYVTRAGTGIDWLVCPSPTLTVSAGFTTVTFSSVAFAVEAGDTVTVDVTSPNAADSDVNCVGRLYDATPLQPVTAGREAAIDASGHVTLANGAHGGAAAGLTLANYAAFKAAGFSTHSAADAGTDAASKVLATPAQLLATDASGHVTAGTVSDKTDYSLSTAGVAAIWNALTSGLTTAGSIGKWILDNVLLRTTWTDARAGYVDKLNVSGTLAHSDAAATYKATGFSTHAPAAVVSAMSNAGYTTARAALLDRLDQTLTALGTAIRGADNDTLKTISDELAAAVTTIRGADADTLKTLSDQLDEIGSQANVTMTGKEVTLKGEETS